ncbi:Histone-lysine N-methyltransferase SUVR1 [Morella rubra]|uniref:Histone-lysine N-methyltransferase SUVR1 n=1 Tax=Morella rubra TaxID=262757 RepID=A0A6A1VM21_9ROSI|nr:Histone-lysine N-methyltransferase SUVR1 [Morella rubra]
MMRRPSEILCLDANLVEIPVKVESPDHIYYHLAFFTTRDVAALEELTWDYGFDFDDHDQPWKSFQCRCGSRFCRNMKRSMSVHALLIYAIWPYSGQEIGKVLKKS